MKKKEHFFPLALFVLLCACFLTFQITYTETDSYWRENVTNMINSPASSVSQDLAEISETVSENFVGKVDDENASKYVLSGYVESLDRFSMYMDKEQYERYLLLQNTATSKGIGVNTLYDANNDGIYVVNVYKGSPASSAGIVPGDIITHVDGQNVGQIGFYGAMSKIASSDEDTSVSVTVRKISGASVTRQITRSDVSAGDIYSENLGDGIGLINIDAFSAGDEEIFKTALGNLIMSGCDKFVLDVRNNPGGNIETISQILDFLVKDGELFTVTDKSGATNTVLSDTNSVPYPLAVLINEGTVCGAEVFAYCLGEYDTARLFGTNTYGKASTQSVISVSTGGAVCLSTSFYTVKGGKSFEDVGVAPDVEVVLSDEKRERFTTLSNDEDDQLIEAVEYLKTQQSVSGD